MELPYGISTLHLISHNFRETIRKYNSGISLYNVCVNVKSKGYRLVVLKKLVANKFLVETNDRKEKLLLNVKHNSPKIRSKIVKNVQ